MAASDAFFSIVELVEHILSYCSEKDILLAQRVNQQWRRIIRHSPLLRRQLFLDQVQDRQTWAMTESIHRTNITSHEPRICTRSRLSLERRALYLWRLRVLGRVDRRDISPRSELRLRTPAKLNPLFNTGVISGKQLNLDERASKSPCIQLSFEANVFEDEKDRDTTGLREQMFLTQPPCAFTKCRLTLKRNIPARPAVTTNMPFVQCQFVEFEYRNDDGIRIRDILAAAKREYQAAKRNGSFEAFERFDFTVRMPAVVEMVEGDAEEVEQRTLEWRKCQQQFGSRLALHRSSDVAWQHSNGDIAVHG